MSASLVGSEMCIRDRSKTVRKLVYAPFLGHVNLEPPARRTRSGGHAVSYTHLTLPTICSV
eukprot:2748290-Alexandrium_andersonii.AAC.1